MELFEGCNLFVEITWREILDTFGGIKIQKTGITSPDVFLKSLALYVASGTQLNDAKQFIEALFNEKQVHGRARLNPENKYGWHRIYTIVTQTVLGEEKGLQIQPAERTAVQSWASMINSKMRKAEKTKHEMAGFLLCFIKIIYSKEVLNDDRKQNILSSYFLQTLSIMLGKRRFRSRH